MGFAEWCLVAMGLVATDSVEQRLVVKGLVAMGAVVKGFVVCFREPPAVDYLLVVEEAVVVAAALVQEWSKIPPATESQWPFSWFISSSVVKTHQALIFCYLH